MIRIANGIHMGGEPHEVHVMFHPHANMVEQWSARSGDSLVYAATLDDAVAMLARAILAKHHEDEREAVS